MGNQEAQKSKTERKIQRTKNKWLPALQELVTNIGEKFSLAFERESYFFLFFMILETVVSLITNEHLFYSTLSYL